MQALASLLHKPPHRPYNRQFSVTGTFQSSRTEGRAEGSFQHEENRAAGMATLRQGTRCFAVPELENI